LITVRDRLTAFRIEAKFREIADDLAIPGTDAWTTYQSATANATLVDGTSVPEARLRPGPRPDPHPRRFPYQLTQSAS